MLQKILSLSIVSHLYKVLVYLIAAAKFKNRSPLSPEERQYLINLFASGYYIILTENKYNLSSFVIKLLTLAQTGKWSRYTHALMNCDNMISPDDVSKFKFMEATEVGTRFIDFDTAFDCNNVCILSPKNITNEQWTKIIDRLIEQDGKLYDDLFDLSDQTKLSCVELVRAALQAVDSYEKNFVDLERLIDYYGNLTPQMFRECSDFEVIWETN